MAEEEASTNEESLPFSKGMQSGVLGHLLENNSFFMQSKDKLLPEWFVDPATAKLWKFCLDFFTLWSRQPTTKELEECDGMRQLDQLDRNKLKSHIQICLMARGEFGLDVVRGDLTLWLKARTLKKGVTQVTTAYNSAQKDRKRFQDAFRIFKQCAADIEKASFDPDPLIPWEDIATGAFFHEEEKQRDRALTWGCRPLDSKLLPEASDGRSLQRGDHTLILAATNGGKTRTMLSIIAANLQLLARPSGPGVRILYVSHEGRPLDLKRNILASFLMRTPEQLRTLAESAEGQKILLFAQAILDRSLDYMPMNKPGLTVEDVQSAILIAQERSITRYGRGYDLIVDDYPAKLSTQLARGGQLQRRHIDEIIYNVFTQIALELDCHMLTAIQANRQASKINQGQAGVEHRLLVKEDVSEAFGPIQTATNVISLNRDLKAEANNRMTFHVCKSRSNLVGWSVVTQTRFDQSRTHGIGLHATWYRGTSTLNDRIDDLLKQYGNKAIPESYYDLG